MTKERTTAARVFPDRNQAERAVQRLRSDGFRDDQIGVAMREGGTRGTDEGTHDHPAVEGDNQAGKVAAKGALTGTVLGGLIGAASTLIIPGVGPFLAGGILAGVLTGAVTGAASGGVAGALVGMGIPETEANYYQGELERGGVLVTVKAGDRYDDAMKVLRGAGGYDASDARPRMGESKTAQSQTVELKEERLTASKQPVESGEVRVGKRVIEDQKTIEVPVTREEAVIERRPVQGRPTSDHQIGDDEEIRVPLREEKVDVQKRAVVTEEVSVGKRPVTETKTVTDTVKREEAEIEDDTPSRNSRG